MPLEHPLDPPRDRGDEVDRSDRVLQSVSADGEGPAVRGECRGVEHALITGSDRRSEHADRLAAGHVPEPDRLVIRDGDQLLSIRREEDLSDGRGVPAGIEDQDRRDRRRFLGPDMLTGSARSATGCICPRKGSPRKSDSVTGLAAWTRRTVQRCRACTVNRAATLTVTARFAESVFRMTSLHCEIVSGLVDDLQRLHLGHPAVQLHRFVSQFLLDQGRLAQEMGQGVIHILRHFLDRLLLEKAEVDRGLRDDELQMISTELRTLGQNGLVRIRYTDCQAPAPRYDLRPGRPRPRRRRSRGPGWRSRRPCRSCW